MNIVFYILIILAAILVFGASSSLFERIGDVAIKSYENIMKNLREGDNE